MKYLKVLSDMNYSSQELKLSLCDFKRSPI